MAADAREHGSVAAAGVLPDDVGYIGLAKQEDDLGMAVAGGQHQRSLVVFIEGDGVFLVPGDEEERHDIEVPEGTC